MNALFLLILLAVTALIFAQWSPDIGRILARKMRSAMGALAADTPRTIELGDINELPVKGSTKIYEGAAVGLTSGYARGLVAGDQFQGFCTEVADNSGSATNGAINVKVRKEGSIQATITSVAVTDVGAKAYMSDDGTFTLEDSGNSVIGYVERYVAANTCIIKFYVTPA